MDLTPRIPADRQVIQGYGAGGFRISQVRHEGGVLVFPDRVLAWPAAAMADVTAASLEPLRGSGVELLLLGCGRAVAYAPAPLRQTVRSWGIVIDAMDTGAACRTYNVLLAEERRVAAALIPLG